MQSIFLARQRSPERSDGAHKPEPTFAVVTELNSVTEHATTLYTPFTDGTVTVPGADDGDDPMWLEIASAL